MTEILKNFCSERRLKMKNIFLNLCVAAGLVLGIFQPVSAANFIQCDSYVNIRQQPSTSSSIVGYIQNEGYIQDILEDTQNGWSKIKSGNVIGWVDNSYIINARLGEVGYTVAIVKKENMPITKYQNPNSEVIATLTKGDTIECVKQEGLSIILAFKNGEYGFADTNSVRIRNYCITAQTIEEKQNGKDTVIEMVISQPFEKTAREEKQEPAQPIIQTNENIQSNISNQSTSAIEEIVYQNDYIENDYSTMEENFYNNQDNYNEFYYDNFDYNYNNYYEQEEIVEDSVETGLTEIEPSYEIIEEEVFCEEEFQQQPIYEENEEIIYDQEIEPLQQETNINTSNSDIIAYGNQFVGNPYVWGGNSLTDGIDCSHFVWQVLSNTGHYSGDYEVSDGWANLGEEVGSLDEAVAGDVIVYPGHVALYDGQGSLLQARGSAYGITNDRDATYNDILAIRHFD